MYTCLPVSKSRLPLRPPRSVFWYCGRTGTGKAMPVTDSLHTVSVSAFPSFQPERPVTARPSQSRQMQNIDPGKLHRFKSNVSTARLTDHHGWPHRERFSVANHNDLLPLEVQYLHWLDVNRCSLNLPGSMFCQFLPAQFGTWIHGVVYFNGLGVCQ